MAKAQTTTRRASQPKPPPGSAESLRQKTAELKSDVALLKAAKVVELEAAEPQEDLQAVSRAYARWLKARAAIKGDQMPEDEKGIRGLFADERTALRKLFSLPAANSDDIWQKFEAFEAEFMDERVIGEARDSVLLLGLGSIKADLLNFDIGSAS